jgi:SAM-dependent methyltransferase
MREPPVAPNSPLGKAVLARIRGADHAHAGEEEAIALTLASVSPDPDRRVLDVGCGRGGSAEWVRRHGYGRVTGIDLDAESIAYARERYPDCDFVACDVLDVADAVEGGFGLVYGLNAFYAFPDLLGALRAVRAVAARGAQLLIFDYVREDLADPKGPLLDPHGPAGALGEHFLVETLTDADWGSVLSHDVSADYVRWYEGLLDNLAAKRSALDEEFGAEIVSGLQAFYAELLVALRLGEVGGAVYSAIAE